MTKLLLAALTLVVSGVLQASEPDPDLTPRITALEQQIADLKRELRATQVRTEDINESHLELITSRVDALQEPSDSAIHVAGYGAYSFASADGGEDAFNEVLFAPIFHYQYRDLLLFESELEFEIGEDDETAGHRCRI